MFPHKDVARFNRHVKKRARGCWVWTGDTVKANSGTYGRFTTHVEGERKYWRAHRYAWILHYGPIPDKMLVLHHCDNTLCTRPSHLFLGTHADNTQDMLHKKRGKGTHGPGGKLDEHKVREIRRLWATGTYSMKQIGDQFGVSAVMVHHVVHRRWWAHVP